MASLIHSLLIPPVFRLSVAGTMGGDRGLNHCMFCFQNSGLLKKVVLYTIGAGMLVGTAILENIDTLLIN